MERQSAKGQPNGEALFTPVRELYKTLGKSALYDVQTDFLNGERLTPKSMTPEDRQAKLQAAAREAVGELKTEDDLRAVVAAFLVNGVACGPKIRSKKTSGG